jgi:anthranilate phosphoribosyltransferase
LLATAPESAVATAERLIADVGLCFLFAPAHHGALRHAAPVRRELGVRTIFNLLGPLANPASVRRQLVGVFDARWVEPVARALGALGAERVLVVHGAGLDEIATEGETEAAVWEGAGGEGRLERRVLRPDDFGLRAAPVADLAGGDAAENARLLRAALTGGDARRQGAAGVAAHAALCANAGAALWVAGRAVSLREGAEHAAAALDAGEAGAKLEAFVAATRGAAGAGG